MDRWIFVREREWNIWRFSESTFDWCYNVHRHCHSIIPVPFRLLTTFYPYLLALLLL